MKNDSKIDPAEVAVDPVDARAALALLLVGRSETAVERILHVFEVDKLTTVPELVANDFDPDVVLDHIEVEGFDLQTLFDAVANGHQVTEFNARVTRGEGADAIDLALSVAEYMAELRDFNRAASE